LSGGFQGKLAAPVELGADGRLDIAKWVFRNGLDPQSVIDVGFVSNAMLPMILREMHVALQPSRAEACTSLPVKEAMACEVPVIAARNTGMTDLLDASNCIALERQGLVADANGAPIEGWGESDVDEIVAALEFAYEDRERASMIGARSRAWLIEHGRTWQAHASELKQWLLSMQHGHAARSPAHERKAEVSAAAPETLLLLYTNRDEPVTRVILDNAARFGCEVIALSLPELLNEVSVGPVWQWAGRKIEPARTGVVNRLTSIDSAVLGGESTWSFRRTQLWIWLGNELRRFAYASSLPAVNSIMGGYGSLVDQWLDLPALVGGLRVPAHRKPWDKALPPGDVYFADPWQLYSLGEPASAGAAAQDPTATLAYARPQGMLVHAAQVGGAYFLANEPPHMTPLQQNYMAAYLDRMSRVSTSRILEHAFFVGDDLPVFFATFPIPVLTGNFAEYRDLVIQGLCDDLKRRSRLAA
jgi:hypothetical protein